jgi:hypothetical protein
LALHRVLHILILHRGPSSCTFCASHHIRHVIRLHLLTPHATEEGETQTVWRRQFRLFCLLLLLLLLLLPQGCQDGSCSFLLRTCVCVSQTGGAIPNRTGRAPYHLFFHFWLIFVFLLVLVLVLVLVFGFVFVFVLSCGDIVWESVSLSLSLCLPPYVCRMIYPLGHLIRCPGRSQQPFVIYDPIITTRIHIYTYI